MDGVIVVDKPPAGLTRCRNQDAAPGRHAGAWDIWARSIPWPPAFFPWSLGAPHAWRSSTFAAIRYTTPSSASAMRPARTTATARPLPNIATTRSMAMRSRRFSRRFVERFFRRRPPFRPKKSAAGPPMNWHARTFRWNSRPSKSPVHRLDVMECEGSRLRIEVALFGRHILARHRPRTGAGRLMRAYLEGLRRTAASGFSIEQARTLDALQQLASEQKLVDASFPPPSCCPSFPLKCGSDYGVADPQWPRFPGLAVSRPQRLAIRQSSREDGSLIAVGEAKLRTSTSDPGALTRHE